MTSFNTILIAFLFMNGSALASYSSVANRRSIISPRQYTKPCHPPVAPHINVPQNQMPDTKAAGTASKKIPVQAEPTNNQGSSSFVAPNGTNQKPSGPGEDIKSTSQAVPMQQATTTITTAIKTTTSSQTSEPALPTMNAGSTSPNDKLTTSSDYYSNVSPKYIDDALNAHNTHRNSHGIKTLLSWDADIAQRAQNYANVLASKRCQLEHSNVPDYGENLYMIQRSSRLLSNTSSTPSDGTYPHDSVNAYMTERLDVGFNHATQVLWSGSRLVGCGSAFNSFDGLTCHVQVCNYFPRGNIAGYSYDGSKTRR